MIHLKQSTQMKTQPQKPEKTYASSTSFRLSLNKASNPSGYQMNGSHQKNSPRLSPDKGVRKYPAVNVYTKICIPKKLPKTSNTNLLSKRLSPPLLQSTFLKQGRHRWILDKQGRQNIGYSHASPHFLPRKPIFPNHESSQSVTTQKFLTSCSPRTVEHLLCLQTIL
jgi:hypothetical protein